ncbi:ANTAR domain-containing protein [Streptomyces sp. NPDC058284]|uniref:ANTAR domain-containing protein n=1 Tax=unclassified Streptomyces TaxID=2593676 RepID=UPI00365951A3
MRDPDSELRLAEVLVETADTLADDFDTERYLRWLSDRSVELLGAQGVGVMYTGGAGTVRLIPSSRQQERVRDLLAVQHLGGPCLESFGSRRPVPPVRIGSGRVRARWPAFTGQAVKYGVAETYAAPMHRRGAMLGVLNVFVPGTRRPATSEREFRAALALARAAAVGLANRHAFCECRTLSEQLQTALDSRIRIEQAKGILAERWKSGVDEAFEALRSYARREQQSLDLVAAAVIKGSVGSETLLEGIPRPAR